MHYWYCTDGVAITGQFSQKNSPTSWLYTSQNPKEQFFVLEKLVLYVTFKLFCGIQDKSIVDFGHFIN